ncbi:kinase-like protein [Auricularia subglabra TFB-10046 SS5]|nr:kinase-like protein [Auricularia subglabra TFB-10046 SS5]
MGAVCCCCCCPEEPVDLNTEVDLYHFELHRAVGKGAFGKVRVVEHKLDNKLYALKYINKRQCIEMRAVANIVQERRLLEEIDHTFICNMRFAFQDDDNCFMVLDLMLGGDLRFHFERSLTLGEDSVRFYVAELSSAVAYLHSNNIIHRDIKPDNVLLDQHGHAHLTDFNVACHYESKRPHTSVAGTCFYMAPEMIYRKGYTYTVDWFSLGAMAFELIFGRRPFQGKKTKEIMRKIMHDTPEYPAPTVDLVSADAKDCIMRLLEKNPSKRLGCKPKGQELADIRSHPWFAGYDWEKLDKKAMIPPFVPDPKKMNFDFGHELDEYMAPSELLTHKKRKGRDINKLSPEMRQLEEEFTVWDYTKMTRQSYYKLTQPVKTVKPSAGTGSPVPSRPGTAMAAPPPAALRSHNHSSDAVIEMEELSGSGASSRTGSHERVRTPSPTKVVPPIHVSLPISPPRAKR